LGKREEEGVNVLGSLSAQSFERISLLSDFLWIRSRAPIALISTDAAILVGLIWVAKEVGGVGLVMGSVSDWR
jgi:hypothetical protein